MVHGNSPEIMRGFRSCGYWEEIWHGFEVEGCRLHQMMAYPIHHSYIMKRE